MTRADCEHWLDAMARAMIAVGAHRRCVIAQRG